MAIPVLLILAVLWAAVLVPPVLRSRTQSRHGGIGDFTSRFGALTGRHSSPRSMGARPNRSLRAVPPPRLGDSTRPPGVTGRPGSGARPVQSPGLASAPSGAMTPAQKRRRDVLVILGFAVALTLGLAVLVNPMLWVVQLMVDALLGGYVYLLVQLKQRGSLAGPLAGPSAWTPAVPQSRSVALAHPAVPARPELAPMAESSPPLRRVAAR